MKIFIVSQNGPYPERNFVFCLHCQANTLVLM